ncbi:MAG TPA: KOW domain-containing RNA-binding protein [Bacillota bacterium]
MTVMFCPTVDGLRRGQMVRSTQGRDFDQYYLIVDLVGDRYIMVVDGSYHRLARPKKKNLKHVKITMLVAKNVEKALMNKESLTDSVIVAAINKLKNELEEGERLNG